MRYSNGKPSPLLPPPAPDVDVPEPTEEEFYNPGDDEDARLLATGIWGEDDDGDGEEA